MNPGGGPMQWHWNPGEVLTPWCLAIPVLLAVLIAAGYLLLAAWMRLHRHAVAQQYMAAFAREREISREKANVNA